MRDQQVLQEEIAEVQQQFPEAHALDWDEAKRLQNQHGKNILSIAKPVKWYKILGESFASPFNLILMLLATVSAATQDIKTTVILLVMLTLGSVLRFYQELKSNVAASNLRQLVDNKCAVIRVYQAPDDRDPNMDDVQLIETGAIFEMEISMDSVVPGDLIRLRAGDLIPGDVQILKSKDLFVSEVSLTGESLPVAKKVMKIQEGMAAEDSNKLIDPMARKDCCFMGSSVVSGTALVIVRAIGAKTLFGELAVKLAKQAPVSAYAVGVRQVSLTFFGLMCIMLPIVFLLSGLIQKDWVQAALFSIAVAVGLTPEMLPMILNANLSRGAIVMSKKRTIVKKLESIINMGSMDVLCTDKTGTLTQNKVAVMRHIDIYGEESKFCLEMAHLNSYFQTGLKNLIDYAILEHYQKIKSEFHASEYVKVDEIPFDFARRRMSVVLQKVESSEQSYLFVSKGAVEEMLAISTHCIGLDGSRTVMTVQLKQLALNKLTMLNEDGLRVIGVGYKYLGQLPVSFDVDDESDIIFAGLIGFLDPPKESAAPAIKRLQELGITMKILTGDSPVVCSKVCREIGLEVKGIVTTSDLHGLSDSAVQEKVDHATIFAKLTPLQKAQVVKALKKNGHIVGFLGDGINDSAALKESDVGISVDDAVDVAKETCDVIVLEKSLMVLVDGVIEGRRTFGNSIKYIKMAVSSNFGNVLSLMIAAAWLPFLPMLPAQLVLQNLLYDASQTVIPFDNMDPEFIQIPQRWSPQSIIVFMLCIGPISSIFDIATYIFSWFYYNCTTNPEACEPYFQSSWFLVGICTQCLVIHMIRTAKLPFVQSVAVWPLILSSSLAVVAAFVVVFTPIQTAFYLVTPPAAFYPFLLAMVIGYCVMSQIGKMVFIKRFKHWL